MTVLAGSWRVSLFVSVARWQMARFRTSGCRSSDRSPSSSLHPGVWQHFGELGAGGLRLLIGIEDPGRAISGQCLLQRLDAKTRIHEVRQLPTQHPAAVPAHDGDQIEEPSVHRDAIGVDAPDPMAPAAMAAPFSLAMRRIPMSRWPSHRQTRICLTAISRITISGRRRRSHDSRHSTTRPVLGNPVPCQSSVKPRHG